MTSACWQKVAASSGSNCAPARSLCQGDGGSGAADPVGHLGELADLRPVSTRWGWRRHEGSRASPCRPTVRRPYRPPLAPPRADRAARRAGEPRPSAGRSCCSGRGGRRRRTRRRRGNGAAAGSRCRASASWPGPPQAPELVVVLVGLERDVVAEPLGLLMGVGMTADVDEQGRVVDDGSLVLAKPDRFGETHRDHGLAQHVLHRLAEPEIDPQ